MRLRNAVNVTLTSGIGFPTDTLPGYGSIRPLLSGYNAVDVFFFKVGIRLTPMLAQSVFSSQVMHGLRGGSTSP